MAINAYLVPVKTKRDGKTYQKVAIEGDRDYNGYYWALADPYPQEEVWDMNWSPAPDVVKLLVYQTSRIHYS